MKHDLKNLSLMEAKSYLEGKMDAFDQTNNQIKVLNMMLPNKKEEVGSMHCQINIHRRKAEIRLGWLHSVIVYFENENLK